MSTMNQDGYESALLGNRPHRTYADITSAALLYARGGLYARVVDLPADKAVARGVEIEGDTEGLLADELDRLGALPVLADALRWARLSGGAGIVLLADDAAANEPMDTNRLGTIEELRVYPLTCFAPHGPRYSDPTQKSYGEPQWYRVSTGSANFIVHETRIIPVSGDPLPPTANASGVPWAGRNAVDRAYCALQRYCESLEMANSILQRKQQAVYGMAGLADMILQGQEAAVQKRISLVDAVRGVLNTVAVDSEDAYHIEDTQLGGVKDVITEQQVAVSAESGIPTTLLFKLNATGLSNSSAADFQGYHEMVEGLQRTRASPAMERLIALIIAQTTFMANLDDWTVVWPALESPTETEEAEVQKSKAEALNTEMFALSTAVGLSVISEREAREYIEQRELFGMERAAADGRAGRVRYAEQTE